MISTPEQRDSRCAIEVIAPLQTPLSTVRGLSHRDTCQYPTSPETILSHYPLFPSTKVFIPSILHISHRDREGTYESMQSRVCRIRDIINHYQRTTLPAIRMLKLPSIGAREFGLPRTTAAQIVVHYQGAHPVSHRVSQRQK
jgi:hypothetical protein